MKIDGSFRSLPHVTALTEKLSFLLGFVPYWPKMTQVVLMLTA